MKNEPQPHSECAPIPLSNGSLQGLPLVFGVVLVVLLFVVHPLGTMMTGITELLIPNLASAVLCWQPLSASQTFNATVTDA